VQPLIDVARGEVEAFCRALRLRPRRDPMNDDRRYLRNALRLDVLPDLERATGRSAKASIVRTADLLRADRDEIEAESSRAYRRVVTEEGAVICLDADALVELSAVIAGRVVRTAVYRTLSNDRAAPWSRDAIAAILDLARGRSGRSRDLPDGHRARRTRTHVVIER